MEIDEISKHLILLKIHIDQIDEWVRQAADMVYAIEENIFDIKDKEYSQKYQTPDRVEFLKGAATGINQTIDSPARLNSSRCSKDHIAAAGFYQSDFYLNKIVYKNLRSKHE
jgi:hypothetical protein